MGRIWRGGGSEVAIGAFGSALLVILTGSATSVRKFDGVAYDAVAFA